MLTFKDLVTGDIGNSPADREVAPLLYFIGFPIFAPCTLIYYTAKGIKYVGGKIVDRIESERFYKEMERLDAIESNGSDAPLKTISRSNETAMPIVETKQNKKIKKLTLKKDNKKM